MKTIHIISFILLIIGGLNWLLVGLGGWDVVAMIFGTMSTVSRIIYILVGLAAIAKSPLTKRCARLATNQQVHKHQCNHKFYDLKNHPPRQMVFLLGADVRD